jgi:hypothetical protein
MNLKGTLSILGDRDGNISKYCIINCLSKTSFSRLVSPHHVLHFLILVCLVSPLFTSYGTSGKSYSTLISWLYKVTLKPEKLESQKLYSLVWF